jgi:hypothetical protein
VVDSTCRVSEPRSDHLQGPGEEVVDAGRDLGQQPAQATRGGQQAEPVVEPVTAQEADREQAQLGTGEEHDLGPPPARSLGPFGADGKEVEELVGGQVTGERRPPDLQAGLGGVPGGHLQPLRVASGRSRCRR